MKEVGLHEFEARMNKTIFINMTYGDEKLPNRWRMLLILRVGAQWKLGTSCECDLVYFMQEELLQTTSAKHVRATEHSHCMIGPA